MSTLDKEVAAKSDDDGADNTAREGAVNVDKVASGTDNEGAIAAKSEGEDAAVNGGAEAALQCAAAAAAVAVIAEESADDGPEAPSGDAAVAIAESAKNGAAIAGGAEKTGTHDAPAAEASAEKTATKCVPVSDRADAVVKAIAVAMDAQDPLSAEPTAKEVAAAAAIAAAIEPKLSSASAKQPPSSSSSPRKKRRMCKFPGCSNTVKAQGHCQRHGAKTKRCKAPGCPNQAQGSHEGYCKRHWREFAAPQEQRGKGRGRGGANAKKKKAEEESAEIQPVGFSVYDDILPASFVWKAGSGGKSPRRELNREGGEEGVEESRTTSRPPSPLTDIVKDVFKVRDDNSNMDLIPILQHLHDNQHLDPGWHRANERLARGIRPPKSISTQLESWEKQLAVLEMALVAGTDTCRISTHGVSKLLAHAWGREKGFHKLMLDKHCARRGNLERKKRVDAGVPMNAERRAAYKVKFEATRVTKRSRTAVAGDEEGAVELPPPQGDVFLEDYEELPPPGGEQMEAWQIEESPANQQLVARVLPTHPMEQPSPMEEPSMDVEEVVPGKVYEM